MTAPTKLDTAAPQAPTYQDILQRDSRPAPAIMRPFPRDLGVEPIKASRYTSREFFQKEVEKVFLKTWQYAVREEEIPNAGDTYIFDLLDKSLLITRQADGTIRAMQNVCLHRGRKLATQGGCKEQFRCPYHGLTWNTDGSFRHNPFSWDFPQIDETQFGLPQTRVESWAGFVFVNFDSEAPPLLDQLSPMPEHFERWRIEDCFMAAHVGKIAHANWKVCAEAFLETHHVITTHPQVGGFSGYDSAQYDVLSDHVTRFLTPSGVTPGTYHERDVNEARRLEMMFATGSRSLRSAGGSPQSLASGSTARIFAAELGRNALSASTGFDFTESCDAEIIDGISYDVFPNFHLWGGFRDKIAYRFRPLAMDPEKSIMEAFLFKLAPKGSVKPGPAALRMLSDDEPWAAADELGGLGALYDQDMSNMGPVQEGLRNLGEGYIQPGRYLEARVRNLHRMIDVYIAR